MDAPIHSRPSGSGEQEVERPGRGQGLRRALRLAQPIGVGEAPGGLSQGPKVSWGSPTPTLTSLHPLSGGGGVWEIQASQLALPRMKWRCSESFSKMEFSPAGEKGVSA